MESPAAGQPLSPLRDLSNTLPPTSATAEKPRPPAEADVSGPPPPPPSPFIFSPIATELPAQKEVPPPPPPPPPIEEQPVEEATPSAAVLTSPADQALAVLRFQNKLSPIALAAGNVFFAALIKSEFSMLGFASWGLLSLLCFGFVKPSLGFERVLTAADIEPYVTLGLRLINHAIKLRADILSCRKPTASLAAFVGTWAVAAASSRCSSLAFLWAAYNLAFALPAVHTSLSKHQGAILAALKPLEASAYEYPKSLCFGMLLVWIQASLRIKALSAVAAYLAVKAFTNNNAEAAVSFAKEVKSAEETVKVMASKGLAQARRMSLGGKKLIMQATGGMPKKNA